MCKSSEESRSNITWDTNDNIHFKIHPKYRFPIWFVKFLFLTRNSRYTFKFLATPCWNSRFGSKIIKYPHQNCLDKMLVRVHYDNRISTVFTVIWFPHFIQNLFFCYFVSLLLFFLPSLFLYRYTWLKFGHLNVPC